MRHEIRVEYCQDSGKLGTALRQAADFVDREGEGDVTLVMSQHDVELDTWEVLVVWTEHLT